MAVRGTIQLNSGRGDEGKEMVIPTQGWMRCPRGELAHLAARLRTRRLVKTALTVAAVLMATIITATTVQVVANVSGGWTSSNHGSCGDGSTAPAPATDGCEGSNSKPPE